MQITVDLPDDIAKHTDPGREALEALVVEPYRSRKLTQFQAGQLLGLSRKNDAEMKLLNLCPRNLNARS
jgi:hypothetical protein